MLILGIILILVGAALAYFVAEPIARFGAAVLVIVGVILVVVAVIDTAHTNTATYGTGRTATYGTGKPMATYGTGRPLLLARSSWGRHT